MLKIWGIAARTFQFVPVGAARSPSVPRALYNFSTAAQSEHGSRSGVHGKRGASQPHRRRRASAPPPASLALQHLERAARRHLALVRAEFRQQSSLSGKAVQAGFAAQQLLPDAAAIKATHGARSAAEGPPWALHDIAAVLRACCKMVQSATLLLARCDATHEDAALLAPGAAALQVARRALAATLPTCSHTAHAHRTAQLADILQSLAPMARAAHSRAPPQWDAPWAASPRIAPVSASDAAALLRAHELEPVVQHAAWLLHKAWLDLVAAPRTEKREPRVTAPEEMRGISRALAAFAGLPQSRKLNACRSVIICQGACRCVRSEQRRHLFVLCTGSLAVCEAASQIASEPGDHRLGAAHAQIGVRKAAALICRCRHPDSAAAWPPSGQCKARRGRASCGAHAYSARLGGPTALATCDAGLAASICRVLDRPFAPADDLPRPSYRCNDTSLHGVIGSGATYEANGRGCCSSGK